MSQDHDRIEALEKRMDKFESSLDANTEVTLRIECNTKELVELLKMARTGVRFFAATGRVLRKLAVWFGPFIALASFLYAISHGKLPGSNP